MKIWENFKTIAQFEDTKNKRRCWGICDDCQKPWDEIETSHVHMKINGEGQTRFICNNCKP